MVTDDLVENNRDVRPLVRYVTGERIRKGRSIARRAILGYRYSLYTRRDLRLTSYELPVNVPENGTANFP